MTTIEWTQNDDGSPGKTWNPTRGCSRVSSGCVNCYAEKVARRFSGLGGAYEGLVHPTGAWNGNLRFVEDALNAPFHWRTPQRVFVNSMSDLFHENVPFDFIDKVFEVMVANARHTFQILTKRPERMFEYMRSESWPRRVTCNMIPPRNVWLGVSAENQDTADERIPILLRTPAAVRFVSFEPLLGPINIAHLVTLSSNGPPSCHGLECQRHEITEPLIWKIDWSIIGGESGSGARPCEIDWIADLVHQCKAHQVATFVKQLGGRPIDPHGRAIKLLQRKGNDMAEWPCELRVREWPTIGVMR